MPNIIPFAPSYNSSFTCTHLRAVATAILSSSLLASLELIKVPAANVQVTLVLVHALTETLDLLATHSRLLVGGVVVLRLADGTGLGFGGLGRAATEHAANGVADGGAYSNTTTTYISI